MWRLCDPDPTTRGRPVGGGARRMSPGMSTHCQPWMIENMAPRKRRRLGTAHIGRNRALIVGWAENGDGCTYVTIPIVLMSFH